MYTQYLFSILPILLSSKHALYFYLYYMHDMSQAHNTHYQAAFYTPGSLAAELSRRVQNSSERLHVPLVRSWNQT